MYKYVMLREKIEAKLIELEMINQSGDFDDAIKILEELLE